MDAFLVEIEPGASAAGTEPNVDGALLVYVLNGRLNLDVGGLRETLDTGDCAYLESDLPLAWEAADGNRCRVLTVAPSEESRLTGSPGRAQ